jgi:hypothetical protein
VIDLADLHLQCRAAQSGTLIGLDLLSGMQVVPQASLRGRHTCSETFVCDIRLLPILD